jgi:cytochrome c-type biogenesis protein CcmH
MIWLALVLLAAAAMLPLAWSLRHAAQARGRREAALALHRAQLAELDRDLAEGRIAAPEHATAVLEVQRRLLAAAGAAEAAPPRASRGPVIATLVLVPLAAFGLYLVGGSPEMPAQPLAQRMARAEQKAREDAVLVEALRQHLAALDPRSERAREGYILLGNAEDQRGDLPAAAEAWHTALAARFDPTLAAQTAEALSRVAGRVTPEAAALFRQALAAAPADAPWRPIAEQRLAEAKAE